MGNVLTQEGVLPAQEDAVESDRQFLMLGSPTIFNDSYLLEMFDKLPAFEGTELEEEDDGGTGDSAKAYAPEMSTLDALRQLQFALRDQATTTGVTVESFPALAYDAKGSAAVDDGYHQLSRMRSRLLQRIHLAMLRDVERGRDLGGTGTDPSNYMRSPPVVEDVSITMTAVSVRMITTFSKVMVQEHPTLASEMCRNVMELLERVNAPVLQRIQPGSVAEDIVRSIIAFTKGAATLWGLNDDARGEALGLLLSLGTTRGNVGDICTVADTMLSKPAPLPEHLSLKFAKTVASRLVPAPLTLPEYGFGNHHVQVRHTRRPEARAPAAAAAVATDGEFLYVFEPASGELIKAGTGFHGTVAGSAVQFSTRRVLTSLLREWREAQQAGAADGASTSAGGTLQETTADEGAIERCWLAVCCNALYMKAFAAHKPCVLQPDEVAIFSLDTLEVLDVVHLQLPVEKWIKARNVSAGVEEPEVILSDRMNLATSPSGARISGVVTDADGDTRDLNDEEVARLVAICDGTEGNEPFQIECRSVAIVVALGERAEVVTHVSGFFKTKATERDDSDEEGSTASQEPESSAFHGAIDVAIAGDDAYFSEYHSEDGSALPHDGFSPVVLPNDEGPPYDPDYRVALGTIDAENSPGEGGQGLRPKRIRFRLSPAEGVESVIIGAVVVTGQERIADDGTIPCPGLVSDGRRLHFPVLEGAARNQRLNIYELAPNALREEGRVVSEVPVDDGCLLAGDNALTGVVPGALHGNGDFIGIMIMQPSGGGGESSGTEKMYTIGERYDGVERQTHGWIVDISKEAGSIRKASGGCVAKWASEPLAWHAAPDAMTYDPLNNMVWFLDALNCKCQAFRNMGPAPRLYPAVSLGGRSDEDLLFCEDPSLRLKAIENTTSAAGAGPAAQAAILMTSLEILGERYAPPLKKVPAQVDAHFEARVISCTSARFSELSFFLRGQDLIRSGFSTAGIYMLLLDESLERAEGSMHLFSTENPANGDRMADFVDTVPHGRTVMVGVGIDGFTNLLATRRGKDALVALGVRREDLAGFTKDDAFSLIGRKGARHEDIKYRKVAQPNVASVSQRLPTPSIPFTLTPDTGTFHALTSILLDNWDIFTEAEFGAAMNAGGLTARRCKMRVAVLLSALNVIGVHIYQSLQGMAAEDVRTLVGIEAIPELNSKLLAVIDTPPIGFAGAAELGSAALRFFVYGIDLFYPTAGEQTALMVDYLQQHRRSELSQSEAFVLDMLIQRASRPETLQRLLNVDKEGGEPTLTAEAAPGQKRRSITSSGADLLASLLAIATSECSMQLARFLDHAGATATVVPDTSVSGVGASAVGLLSNVASCLLSQSAQRIIDGAESDPWTEKAEEDEAVRRAQSGARMLVANMASLCRNATMLCEEGVAASDAHEPERGQLAIQVDQLLEKSPVGAMLPSLVSVVALLLKHHGSKMIDNLVEVVSSIGPLMTEVKKLLVRLPVERHVAAAGGGGKVTTREDRQELESLHPYLDNTDSDFEVCFPGARRITITFDEQSRTESGYDYVKIFTDAAHVNSAHPGVEKLHGRNGDENFPGFGGRPPLVVEQDRVFLKFRTDGSNTDWGWKATFVGEVEVQETAVADQAHWLLSLDRHLANCGGQVSAALIKSLPWGEGIEDEMAEWLEGDLVEKAREATSEEEAKLLDALTFWTGSMPSIAEPDLGEALVRVMKKRVATDVGKVQDIDRAVYATAALMIKTNGLLAEAVCCARGERQPSGALVKLWRTAQNMRQFFMFGDVAADVQSKKQLASSARRTSQKKLGEKTGDAADGPGAGRGSLGSREPLIDEDDDEAPEGPSLSTQRSLFAGAEDEVVREYADRICKRVTFLLGSTTADGALDRGHRKTPSLLRTDSTRDASVDGGRWNMLARAVGSELTRGGSGDLKHKSGEWKTLVDRAKAAEDLKDAMRYRRRVAERRKESKMPSATEKILRFVQLPTIALDKLEKVIERRGQRAQWRHKGLQLAHALLDSVFAPRALANLLAAIGEALRDTRRDEQPDMHVHYANGVEGIDLSRRAALESSFMLFLKSCVSQLRDKLATADLSNIDNGLAAFALSVIRVCTIDYDVIDHDILCQSGLPEVLPILDAVEGDSDAIQALRRAAWASTEILMLRCVGLQDQKMLPPAPTAVGQDLFRLFKKDLGDIASQSAMLDAGSKAFSALTAVPGAVALFAGFMDVSPAVPGIAVPHVPFGFGFTLSFWVKRSPSSVERREAFVIGASAVIGDRVMQGPAWKATDGPPDLKARGTVIGLSPDKIDVRWDGANDAKSHAWSDPAARTVAIVDEGFGHGTLFMKGSLAAIDTRVAWSLFGASLLADGSVAFQVSTDENADESELYVRSASAIPPDTWSSVVVTCTEIAAPSGEGARDGDAEEARTPAAQLQLYMDGSPCAEPLELTGVMLTPGKSRDFEEGEGRIWETAHPYADNMDQEETIRVPGAAGYRIVFDPRSVTENNYDYLRFHRGEGRHGDQLGLDKYSGRRFPELRIEEPVFTLRFVSDGSNNDWGISMRIIPLLPKLHVDVSSSHRPLNEMPFYIGQPPQHIANVRAANARFGGLLLHRTVLEPEAIAALAPSAASVPTEASLPVVDKTRGIFLCSLLARCATSMAGFGMTRLLSQPEMLALTLRLCAWGPSTSTQLRLAAHRLAAVLVRVTEPEVADNQYSIVRTGAAQQMAFVNGLLLEIGDCLFSWVKSLAPEDVPSVREGNKSLSYAKVEILRGLIEMDAWKDRILGGLKESLENAVPVASQLAEATSSGTFRLTNEAKRLLGALHVLGGVCAGLCPGVRAKASVKGRTPEPCTVLSMGLPPPLNVGASLKADRKKRILDGYCRTEVERIAWGDVDENLDALGDAVVVCFNSTSNQPPVMLPASTVAVEDATLTDGVVEGLGAIAPTVLAALEHLSKLKVADDVLALEPMHNEGTLEQVYESSDHADATSFEREVAFPNAESLTVVFDRATRSNGPGDTLTFYKSARKDESWGTYSGSIWPGVAGMEPLKIPSGSMFFTYSCESGATPFPYKFTVTAEVKSSVAAPALAPKPAQTVIKALRLHAIKAVATLLRNKNALWIAADAGRLAPALIDASLEPILEEDGNMQKLPKPVVMESSHPYAHNADDYHRVAFPAGFFMEVTFSDETRSENNCDYLKLFTDDSHSVTYGAERYTGGKDGSARNWPGVDGNPPLLVEAHEMVVHWHTDGSVNDWGWKMTVTPKHPSGAVVNGGDLPLAVLTDRIFHFTNMLAEGHVVPPAVPAEVLASFVPRASKTLGVVPEAPEALDSIASAMEQEVRKVLAEQKTVPEERKRAASVMELIVMRNRRLGADVMEKKVLESAHPYADNHDSTEEIYFPGADSLTLVFDEQTSTENNYDWIKFLLRDGTVAHAGHEKFSGGRGGSRKTFPGLDGEPPLIVQADYVQLQFHTDGSNNDWGYKVTATPDYPTRLMRRPNDDAAEMTETLAMRQRVELLRESGDWVLVRNRPPGVADAMTRTLESEHPYGRHEDRREEVRIPGAAYLLITFDPRSSTKEGAATIGFYSHPSAAATVPYVDGNDPPVFSGGSDDTFALFPNVGDLAPLRVRGDMVQLRWRTDGDDADWGWRFTAQGVTHANAPPFSLERDYRFWRLVVFGVREGGDGVRFRNLRFYDEEGTRLRPEGVSAPKATSPDGEDASALLRENSSACFADGKCTDVLFEFHEGVRVASYEWVTNDSSPGSDVTSWMIEASQDGRAWCCAQDVMEAGYLIPSARESTSPRFVLGLQADAVREVSRESSHPLGASDAQAQQVSVSGALGFSVSFAPECSMAPGEGGIRFSADEGAEQLAMPPGLEVFEGGVGYTRPPLPGVAGAAPHVIFGDSFYYHVTSSGNADQWGFAFTARPLFGPAPEGREGRKQEAEAAEQAFDERQATEQHPAGAGRPDPYDVGVTGLEWLPSATVGWVKRRDDDVEYLVPADAAQEDEWPVLVLDPSLDDDIAATGEAPAAQDPLFEMSDGSSSEEENGSSSLALLRPVTLASGRLGRMASSVAFTYGMARPKLAQAALGRLVDHWPRDLPLSPALAGGEARLLALVRLLYLDPSRHGALTQLLSLNHADKETSPVGVLLRYALGELAKAVRLSPRRHLKPTTCRVATVETAHPYQDNMHKVYAVRLRGARHVSITFDPASATEKDCDYVSFFTSPNCTGPIGAQKYHGRSGTQNFPGMGGRPPLVVEGEEFYALFHSGGSNTDWGFKFTARGIVDESSAAEREAYKTESEKAGPLDDAFACWILARLAENEERGVREVLRSSAALGTFRVYLEAMPAVKRAPLLEMLVPLLQEMGASGGEAAMDGLREVLRKTTREALEQETGQARKPRVVQALVQASVAMEEAVARTGNANAEAGDEEEEEKEELVQGECKESEGTGNPCSWDSARCGGAIEVESGSQVARHAAGGEGQSWAIGKALITDGDFAFGLRVLKVAASEAPPLLGLISDGPREESASLGSVASDLCLASDAADLWIRYRGQKALLGPALQADDVLALRVAEGRDGCMVECWRNGVQLPPLLDATAPEAALHGLLPPGAYRPVAVLGSAGDAVLLRQADPAWGPSSKRAKASDKPEPLPLLDSIRKTSVLLRSLARHELPPSFFASTFLPGVAESATRVVQLLGGDNERHAAEVVVPGAEALRIVVEGLAGSPGPLAGDTAVFAEAEAATLDLRRAPCRGSGTEPPVYALDGEDQTLWSGFPDAEGEAVWMVVDLGAEHALAEFTITVEAAGQPHVKLLVAQSDGVLRGGNDGEWVLVGSYPIAFGTTNTFSLDAGERRQACGSLVQLRFDEWAMVPSVGLVGRRVQGGAAANLAGASLQRGSLRVNGAEYAETKLVEWLAGGPAPSAAPPASMAGSTPGEGNLQVGDKVVRGKDWYWGAQDGGRGGVGEVLGFRSWQGKAGAGVRVRWALSGHEGVYRWKFDGKVDVAKWNADDVKPQAATSGNGDDTIREETGGVRVAGSRVSLGFVGGGSRSQLRLRVEPDFGTGQPSLMAAYPEVYGALSTAFLAGSLQHDRALVAHVNRVARKKRMLEAQEVVGCAWAAVQPDEKDLIRDPCLRQLMALGKGLDGATAEGDVEAVRALLPGSMDPQEEAFSKVWASGRGAGKPRVLSWDHRVVEGDGWAKWVLDVEGEGGCFDLAVLGLAPLAQSIIAEATGDAATADEAGGDGEAMEAAELEKKASGELQCRLNAQTVTGPGSVALVRLKDDPASPTWTLLGRHLRLVRGANVLELFTDAASLLSPVVLLVLRPSAEAPLKASTALTPAVSRSPVEARFRMIQELNGGIHEMLPFVDFALAKHSWSLAGQLSECRGLIFAATKDRLFEEALRLGPGAAGSASPDLTINRPRARKFIGRGECDVEGRWSTFGQAFRVLDPRPPRCLRGAPNTRLWNTVFAGEFAHDAGGPYNECWSQFAQELQSAALPLLLRCPNGVHSVGENRDRWLLNPGARTATQRAMFRFLGKLMGAAARTRNYLNLSLAPLVWKLLAGERVSRMDLASVDRMIVQTMDKMRNVDREGVTAELFSDVFEEQFTTMSLDDRIVPLRPGGASEEVTYENRGEYADLVEAYRLHEMNGAAEALRDGLGMVLPGRVIGALFTGDELERLVCGVQEIDVALLASVTEYSGCNRTDRHVGFFWEALESFDHEDRAALLRFTWGRSRLPMTAEDFGQRFKLQSFNHRPADMYLPVAHTCFFSLELPAYSTLEILQNKLRYAIHNCQAIDGDDTSVGMAAAALGWEAD